MNSDSAAGGSNLANQLYLVWKALNDPTIPWAAKWLIPIAALVYAVSPIDLIPFFPLDDIVVIVVAFNVFTRLIAQYQTRGTGPNNPTYTGAQGSNAQQAPHANPHSNDTGKTIETTWRVIE